MWTSASSQSPDWSGSQGEWRRGRVRPLHLIFTTSRTETSGVLLLNSRDSDSFLTETHECLLGRQQPQGSSWASLLQPQPQQVCRRCQSINPMPQAGLGTGRGGQGPRAPLPGGCWPPATLAQHLWQDSSSSSAKVPSLRASILNSLRLTNKHSFFNGEEKHQTFFCS